MNNIALAGYLKKQIQKYEGGADLESNKNVSITANGTTVVQPSSGKDGMEQVTVAVNVPSSGKEEQTKSVTIQSNGDTTVTPDTGKTLSSVSIHTEVSGGGGGVGKLYAWKGSFDILVYTETENPAVGDKVVYGSYEDMESIIYADGTVVTVNGNSITVTSTSGATHSDTYTRDNSYDVELGDVPTGANMLYAWAINNRNVYLNIDTAPNDLADIKIIVQNPVGLMIIGTFEGDNTYTKVSDDEFTISYEEFGQTVTDTYTRDATKDVEVWNAPPEVETTKQATIDVSTYDPANKPVITPTAGKQSMGSVEVTLSNIPSGGGTAYAWKDSNDNFVYIDCETSPIDINAVKDMKYIEIGIRSVMIIQKFISDDTTVTSYNRISDTVFELSFEGGVTITLTRDSTSDFNLWQLSE